MLVLIIGLLLFQEPAESVGHPDALTPPSETVKADADTGLKAVLPHLRIDRKRQFVDVDATVVFARPDEAEPGSNLVAGQWLELVACTPGMRDYESLLAVKARPSHIHQALLMIGLVPGSPIRRVMTDEGQSKVIAPRGPPVEVIVIIGTGPDACQIPINRWIIDRDSAKPLADHSWLFTGSAFAQVETRPVYLADLNGSVVTLVNFGDDLLARATTVTNRDDGMKWVANAKAIPAAGTELVLRLMAAKNVEGGREGRKLRVGGESTVDSRKAVED